MAASAQARRVMDPAAVVVGWAGYDADHRPAIIDELIEKTVVSPNHTGGLRFDPKRASVS